MIFWLEQIDELLLELDILQNSPHPPNYIIFMVSRLCWQKLLWFCQ